MTKLTQEEFDLVIEGRFGRAVKLHSDRAKLPATESYVYVEWVQAKIQDGLTWGEYNNEEEEKP